MAHMAVGEGEGPTGFVFRDQEIGTKLIAHLELLEQVRELHYLSGADKCPVQGIKQNNKISPAPSLQKIFDLSSVRQCVPKKNSYFAWLKPYKVGNFFLGHCVEKILLILCLILLLIKDRVPRSD